MSRDSELDRDEPATPFKLAQARKRGQVARSTHWVGALMMTSAFVLLHTHGGSQLRELLAMDRRLLALAGTLSPDRESLGTLALQAISSAVVFLLPVFAALCVVAVLANVMQTGPVFSSTPIQPDWTRLNPAAGFARLASVRALTQTLRVCVPLLALSLVAWMGLHAQEPRLRELAGLSGWNYLQSALGHLGSLGFKLAVTLLLIGVLDLAYSRREFTTSMRMSRREQRHELKQREGDPRIRSRLRELRRETMKRIRLLRRTADADVVVVNPTHVAVALCYRHRQMSAPTVVSKGSGTLATAMRMIAARRQIPVIRHPSLARALHTHSQIDLAIPVFLYASVAQVMVWVLASRREGVDGRASAARGRR